MYLQRKFSYNYNEEYLQKDNCKLPLLIIYNMLDLQTMKLLESE